MRLMALVARMKLLSNMAVLGTEPGSRGYRSSGRLPVSYSPKVTITADLSDNFLYLLTRIVLKKKDLSCWSFDKIPKPCGPPLVLITRRTPDYEQNRCVVTEPNLCN